ncbi:hypothetical protein ACFL6I_00380 [candidate division KSB1 bacterium]
MYGEINSQVRINGITSNFQKKRRNENRYGKSKKPFEEFLHEEQEKEPEKPAGHSRFDFRF